MEKIIVHVRDQEKAKQLLDLLAALDFVESAVSAAAAAEPDPLRKPPDFFEVAGIWKNREITAQSIRKQAWPRQQQT
ncbi:hypothetical protein [Candidatus Electronema sp. TJ]|uniref:hypothetical protein n=1 Tax=Candidatus Electronema sp. TJ TaxID=3401573 RepID=UPI003AA7AE93